MLATMPPSHALSPYPVLSASHATVTAHSSLGSSLLVAVIAIAVLCVFLVVLTWLEPSKQGIRPPFRKGPKP